MLGLGASCQSLPVFGKQSILNQAIAAARRNGASLWYVPDDLGLVLGPELVRNGGFDDTSVWTLSNGGTISGGVLNCPAISAAVYATQAGILTPGKMYLTSISMPSLVAPSGGMSLKLGSVIGPLNTVAGTYVAPMVADGADLAIQSRLSGVTSATVDNISVREILSAQIYTDSTGVTPVTAVGDVIGLITDRQYGAGNLGPEKIANLDITNASWSKTNVSVATGTTDPTGGTAAYTLTATAANGGIYYQGPTVLSALQTIWIRRVSGSGTIRLRDAGAGNPINIAPTSTWGKFRYSLGDGAYLGIVDILTSGDVIEVYSPSCKQVLGNHATQPTTNAKPILTRVPRRLGAELSDVASSTFTAGFNGNASLSVGKSYKVSASVTLTSGTNIQVGVENNAYGWQTGNPVTVSTVGTGAISFTFVASDSVGRPSAIFTSAVGSVSNLSVKEVLEWSYAMSFDGSNDKLNTTIQQPSEFTWIAGVNRTAKTGYLFGTANATAAAGSWAHINGYFTEAFGGLTAAPADFQTAVAVDINAPHVLTYKMRAAGRDIYKDGVNIGSSATSGAVAIDATSLFGIGAAGVNYGGTFATATYSLICAAPVSMPDADRKIIERAAAWLAGCGYANGALGPELVVDSAWTTNGSVSRTGGTFTLTAAASTLAAQQSIIQAGKTYQISGTVQSISSGSLSLTLEGGTITTPTLSAAGAWSTTLTATNTGNIFLYLRSSPCTAVVSSISVREVLFT